MARHRHAVNVRADGLTAVLGPLAGDPAVLVALLVDIDSGMVLGAAGHPTGADREALGAAHGELMRLACGDAVGAGNVDPAGLDTEVAISRGPRRHVVVRRVVDPYGDRLALSVLVDGPPRVLRRVRRRLGEVSTAALTAGPTVSLRPQDGAWVPGAVEERPVLRSPSRTQPMAPVPAPAPPLPEPRAAGEAAAAGGQAPLPRRGASPGILAAAALSELTAPSAWPAAPALGPATGPAPGTARQEPVPRPLRPVVDDPQRRPAPPSALPPAGPTAP
jgi:hypothetical protein